MTTRVEARDEIFSQVTASIQANAFAIVGIVPVFRYQGKVETIPGVDKPWLRLSIQTMDEDQETLRNEVRRFRTEGIVFAQLFWPVTDKEGQTKLDKLAEMVRNVFRVRTLTDKVVFTRARINDNMQPEADWLKCNVVSEFEYIQFI